MRSSSFPLLHSLHFGIRFNVISAAQTSHSIPKQTDSHQTPHTIAYTSEQNTATNLSFLKDFSSLISNLSGDKNRNFRLLSTLDSILVNTHIFDSLTSIIVIDNLCRLKKLNRAKSALSDLKRKGRVSNFFLYSLVLQCLVKDGTIKDVESVWTDICGSDQDRIDASDFVVHVCRFGDDLDIRSVYDRILMGSWDLERQSYLALIGALCRINACDLAIDALRKMEEKCFEMDDLTYIVMFQCLCRNGDLSNADLILRILIRRNSVLDICVYGSFIHGLCKTGKFREAEKLFDKLTKPGQPSVNPVSSLKMGRRAIFQLDCHGAVPEIMVYEAYCRSLCSVGKVDEAEILLKKMMRKRTIPEVCVYQSFVKALFRVGRSDDALRFFNVERKKGFISTADIADSVIKGLCESGRVDDAHGLLNDILADGFVPNASVCNCLLGGYWKAGRSDEALGLFQGMKEGKCGRPNISTYAVMISGFCDNRNVDKAVSIFREMIDTGISANATMHKAIIRGLHESGRLQESHEYLNKMIEDGHLVSYVGWKSVFDLCVGSSHNSLLGF